MKIVKHDDVTFLKNCDNWPNWPICTIKRGDVSKGELECVLVFAHEGSKIVVAKLNIFRGWTEDDFEAAEKWEYDTVEDIIQDGWIVD